MNNILLLTDFSDLSNYAKNLADKIGSATAAKLHILKVIDIPANVILNDNNEPLESSAIDLKPIKAKHNDAIAKIYDWSKNLKSQKVSKVLYGQVIDSVKKYIEENAIDLVIMGTHGISGIKELISGSITEQIIKKNTIPVLSLKCDRSDMDFSDFLITGNFGEDKVQHLETFKALQNVFNSNIHLLAINTKKHFQTSSELMNKMKAFAKINRINNVQYHIHNDHSIEEGIVNFSNNYDSTHDLKIDIIAVEKKNKSEIGEFFTHCEAIDLVNHIQRPILSYRKEN